MQTGGLLTSIEGWLKAPFDESMDAWHWALFLGLVIIIGMLWTRVIRLILDAV